MRSIGHLADTDISVRTQATSQEILIAATEAGHILAQLLAGENIRAEGDCLVLTHDQAVDARLKELADVTVAIRYAYPRMVQLTLALDGGGDT